MLKFCVLIVLPSPERAKLRSKKFDSVETAEAKPHASGVFYVNNIVDS